MKFFLSERLTQDPLEIFFGCQRQRGSSNENPNMQQFCKNTQALRVINSVCGNVALGNCRGKRQAVIDWEKENRPLPKRHKSSKVPPVSKVALPSIEATSLQHLGEATPKPPVKATKPPPIEADSKPPIEADSKPPIATKPPVEAKPYLNMNMCHSRSQELMIDQALLQPQSLDQGLSSLKPDDFRRLNNQGWLNDKVSEYLIVNNLHHLL